LYRHPLSLVAGGGVDIWLIPALIGAAGVGALFATVCARRGHARSRMLNAIFELSGIGLAVLDSNRRVVRASTAFAELGGRSVDCIVGKPVDDVFTLPDIVALDHREVRANRTDVEKWACLSSCRIGGGSLTLLTAADSTPLRVADQILARYDADLRKRNEQLSRAANQDALTGLPNRVFLLDRLQHAIGEIAVHAEKLAVVFLDLDGFKPINDQHGHDVGDEVLKVVARRFRKAMRGSDVVGRLGGDEFVVIGPGVHDAAAAEIVANKLFAALANSITVADKELSVGASIGIALCADAGADADTILRFADEAMYEAKRGGRNRFCLHGTQPAMVSGLSQSRNP
jgi:diguanylate cyclase (GGDEF)-like protein